MVDRSTPSTPAGPVVGRVREIAMVAAALAEGTSVLITGAAGMGKTTLAAEAIRSTGRSVRRGAAVRFLEQRSFLSLSSATGAPIRLTDDAGIAADVMAAIGDAILFLDDLQWASADTVATAVTSFLRIVPPLDRS